MQVGCVLPSKEPTLVECTAISCHPNCYRLSWPLWCSILKGYVLGYEVFSLHNDTTTCKCPYSDYRWWLVVLNACCCVRPCQNRLVRILTLPRPPPNLINLNFLLIPNKEPYDDNVLNYHLYNAIHDQTIPIPYHVRVTQWDILLVLSSLPLSIDCFAYNINNFFPLVVHAWR